jgi:hypothetical protein
MYTPSTTKKLDFNSQQRFERKTQKFPLCQAKTRQKSAFLVYGA